MCTVWMWDFEVHDDIGVNGYCDDPNLPVKKQPSLEVHVEKELFDGANSAVSHFSFVDQHIVISFSAFTGIKFYLAGANCLNFF